MTLIAPLRPKPYRLRERTTQFALQVRQWVHRISPGSDLSQDLCALLRSSGAIGASYIAADEAASKSGFLNAIRLCRKECTLSIYWLRLAEVRGHDDLQRRRAKLLSEAQELMLIFGSIVDKGTKSKAAQ